MRSQVWILIQINLYICRSHDINIYRFTTSQFEIAYISPDVQTDADCISLTTGDYLFTPEAQSSDGTRATMWCGTSLSDRIIAGKWHLYLNCII